MFNVEGILGQLLFFLHPDSEVKSSISMRHHSALKAFDQSYKRDMISSLSYTLRQSEMQDSRYGMRRLSDTVRHEMNPC